MMDATAFRCHDTAVAKGFWDYPEYTPDVLLAKLALVHSELSEILEAYRKSKGTIALTEEFADTIIRLLDLWAAMHEIGIVDSLDDALVAKMAVNTTRPHKHGNLI